MKPQTNQLRPSRAKNIKLLRRKFQSKRKQFNQQRIKFEKSQRDKDYKQEVHEYDMQDFMEDQQILLEQTKQALDKYYLLLSGSVKDLEILKQMISEGIIDQKLSYSVKKRKGPVEDEKELRNQPNSQNSNKKRKKNESNKNEQIMHQKSDEKQQMSDNKQVQKIEIQNHQNKRKTQINNTEIVYGVQIQSEGKDPLQFIRDKKPVQIINENYSYHSLPDDHPNHPRDYFFSRYPVTYEVLDVNKMPYIYKQLKINIPQSAHFLDHYYVPVQMDEFIKYNWQNLIGIRFKYSYLTDSKFQLFVKNVNLYPHIKILQLSYNTNLNTIKCDMLSKFKKLQYLNFGQEEYSCRLTKQSIQEVKKYNKLHPHVHIVCRDVQ